MLSRSKHGRPPASTTYPPMRMEVETDRLALRPWMAADAQWLHEMHREREPRHAGDPAETQGGSRADGLPACYRGRDF
jgi:hypothetical protein